MRTMTRVAIARKSLFSDRRRAALGVGGVVLALLIVLAIDGIFAGAMRQVTRYIDTAEADVFVSQQGVRNMHMSSSSMPLTAADAVAALAAEVFGADYFGVTVWSTTTKPAARGVGLERLRTIVRATALPVVGIGGTPRTPAM